MSEQWFRTGDLEFRSDLVTNQIHRILVSPPIEVEQVPGRMVVLDDEWMEYQGGDPDEACPDIYRSEQVKKGAVVRVLAWPGGDYHGGGSSVYLVNTSDSVDALMGSLQQGMSDRARAEAEHGAKGIRAYELPGLVACVRAVCDAAGEISPRELLMSILGNGHYNEHSPLPLACQMAAEQIRDEHQEMCRPMDIQVAGALWLTDGSAAWRANGPQPMSTEYMSDVYRSGIDAEKAGVFVAAMEQGERVYLDPESTGDVLKFMCRFGVQEIVINARFAPVVEGCRFFMSSQGSPMLLVYDESGYRAMIGGIR